MTKKGWFALKITIFSLLCIYLGWKLSTRLSLNPDFKYIEIIVTTAVFLAGFGFLALDKKDSVFFVNVKQIINWPIYSIILAFCYMAFEKNEIWGKMFFTLSVGCLIFALVLVLILVRYHDNPYMKEIEKPKKKK